MPQQILAGYDMTELLFGKQSSALGFVENVWTKGAIHEKADLLWLDDFLVDVATEATRARLEVPIELYLTAGPNMFSAGPASRLRSLTAKDSECFNYFQDTQNTIDECIRTGTGAYSNNPCCF